MRRVRKAVFPARSSQRIVAVVYHRRTFLAMRHRGYNGLIVRLVSESKFVCSNMSIAIFESSMKPTITLSSTNQRFVNAPNKTRPKDNTLERIARTARV